MMQRYSNHVRDEEELSEELYIGRRNNHLILLKTFENSYRVEGAMFGLVAGTGPVPIQRRYVAKSFACSYE
jgi:hypothetical protein